MTNSRDLQRNYTTYTYTNQVVLTQLALAKKKNKTNNLFIINVICRL